MTRTCIDQYAPWNEFLLYCYERFKTVVLADSPRIRIMVAGLISRRSYEANESSRLTTQTPLLSIVTDRLRSCAYTLELYSLNQSCTVHCKAALYLGHLKLILGTTPCARTSLVNLRSSGTVSVHA